MVASPAERCAGTFLPAHKQKSGNAALKFVCAPGWIDPDGHQRILFQVFTKVRGAAGHTSTAVLVTTPRGMFPAVRL